MNRVVENLRSRFFLGGPIRRFYKLKAAYSITTELSSALNLDDALKTFVNRIASYMSVEIVSVMLLDNEKKRLVIKMTRGLDEKALEGGDGPRLGEGVAGWVGKKGEPLLIRDITKDPRFSARSGKTYYNNSLLSVPLKSRDRVIGVVNINNKVSRDIFRAHDLDLLKTIVDMAVIAIEKIRTRDALDKLSRSNHEIMSNVSHEFKTPLTTIKEALLLMSDGMLGTVNEKQKKYLDLSVQNIERLNRLINSLLIMGEVESAKKSSVRNLFSITDTARTVIESLNIVAKEKGIVLKGVIPEKRVEIWGDPDKLNEVISNLVENAIKYNRTRGEVSVHLGETEKDITISVSDTGMGIPREEVGRIFDRFYRASTSSRSGIPGSGLGLSIVKDIIEMHKGQIKVESEPDKGSVFTVTLPKSLRR
ncbi:MAG: GAF domain-containing sensor histidine kinase [Candidatus Omnitrophica bacterium]|nr:GAF domain-containing sensor histidine kinase [Candidatus Omnitrophota bacterium]